jgi:copper oxidase (laccase) domain-containing protein
MLLQSEVPADVVRVKQGHGSTIVGASEVKNSEILADGISASADFEEPFMILTADCLPLVVVTDKAACALHVSRKTLILGLLEGVPQFMKPPDITGVYIGPHVCAEHFVFETVGPEIAAFQKRWPLACTATEDGLHLSLVKAVAEYLGAWGVTPERLTSDPRCTFETPDLPSYRRALRDQQPLTDQIATVVRTV